MKTNELDLIKTSALFRGMDSEELQQALEALRMRRKEYKKDDLLFMAGELTKDMGMVLSGSVTIESNDIWGNRTIITHAGAGDYFAEVFAILQYEPLYVDVRANEATVIAMFDMSGLRELQTASTPWVVRLLGNLLTISIHKNMVLSKRSFHTAPKSARGRIMAYLNSVAMKARKPEFNIPFDRQRMADYLNLDRTALSKELGKMRDDGLIEFRKNHFRILNADRFDV